MLSRGFQIILSALIFICSTLAGMAKTTAQEEVRAEIFVAAERGFGERPVIFDSAEIEEQAEFSVEAEQGLGGKTDKHRENTWDDAAILPSISGAAQSENSVNNGKNQKRNHRRTASPKLHHSKCRILKSLPAKSVSRGVARNPLSQDARQELKAAIRFLHLSALACLTPGRA